MEIYGKIIARFDVRQGVTANGKAWMTREYLLETLDEKYPRKMVFEVFGEDKIKEFNEKTAQKGALVTVSFDIDAREWKGRWFNSVRAWKIEPGQTAQAPAVQQAAQTLNAQPVVTQQSDNDNGDNGSDLPF